VCTEILISQNLNPVCEQQKPFTQRFMDLTNRNLVSLKLAAIYYENKPIHERAMKAKIDTPEVLKILIGFALRPVGALQSCRWQKSPDTIAAARSETRRGHHRVHRRDGRSRWAVFSDRL
jgi:hypothetical protein